MKYEYGNLIDAKAGDILYVESDGCGVKQGDHLIVTSNNSELIQTTTISKISTYSQFIKLVKTKPSSEAKVGDTVICIENTLVPQTIGKTYTVTEYNSYSGWYIKSSHICGIQFDSFLVLCQAKSEPMTSNGISKGMKVRYIGPRNIIRPRQCTVHSINTKNDRVCYKDRYSCEAKHWEIIDESKPEFTYPMWFKSNKGKVVKFDGLKSGKVVVADNDHTVGHVGKNWITHTDKSAWTQVNEPKPRLAVVTQSNGGFSVGSVIVNVHDDNWKLADSPSDVTKCHVLGFSCEWIDELVGTTWKRRENNFYGNKGEIATITSVDTFIHFQIVSSLNYNLFFERFKKHKSITKLLLHNETPIFGEQTQQIKEKEMPKYKIGDVLDASAIWPSVCRTPKACIISLIENGLYIFNQGNGQNYIKDTDENQDIFLVSSNEPTQLNKGRTMSDNITISMTVKEYAKHQKQSEPKQGKTDLQLEYKKPYSAKVFSEQGAYSKRLFAKSQGKLDNLISEHLHRNNFDIIVDCTTHKTSKLKRQPVVQS